jgi:hypothetical protein
MTRLTHKFKIGQTVDLVPSISRFAASGNYQIVSLRPSEGEIAQYSIKSTREPHERVVSESGLMLAADQKFDQA